MMISLRRLPRPISNLIRTG